MKARSLFVLSCALMLPNPAFCANIIDVQYGIGAGSFERVGFPASGFITLPNGDTVSEAWTVGGGSVDWAKSSVWNPSHGTYSIDLNGTTSVQSPSPVGSISTVIPTTAGSTYRVTFDMSGFLGYNNTANPKRLSLTAGGITLDYSFVATSTSTSYPASPLVLEWATATFDFVALAGQTSTLTFTSLITTNESGPLLDNVRVEAIPEPSAPLLLGAAGLPLVLRRRRAR